MKKRLIIGVAAIAVLSVGAVANAMIGNQPVKENQAAVQRSEAVESPVLHSDAVESQATTSEAQAPAVQPVQNTPAPTSAQTAPAVQEEAFDAQLYGMSLLQDKAKQGINMNAECYNKLMVESTGWNMTKAQVDASFAKVLGYSSTCAALATFQATGNY